MASVPEVSAATGEPVNSSKQKASFWRTVTRLEPEKIVYGRAARNAFGVALPLAVGYWAGSLPAGLICTSGALNVCFTDGDDPYRTRARRMILGTLLVSLAVLTGTLTGHIWALSIVILGAWAFSAGMFAALNQTAADMGVTTLVTLIVFSAQPLEPHRAVAAGLLAMLGGALQTALALAFWPVQRHEPERRALAKLYDGLSKAAEAPAAASEAPAASGAAVEAHNTLASLLATHSVEADRYRSLLTQAERMRLSLLALARLRVRIGREVPEAEDLGTLDGFFELCAKVLARVADSLRTGVALEEHPDELGRVAALSEVLRLHQKAAGEVLASYLRDARYQLDAFAGQLRSAVELASHATPEGEEEFERTQAHRPWTLRVRGNMATLRANLSFESAAFRHALRLAGCVMLAASIGHAVSWRRTYWLPMTVAIVLKPDFTATFSRGVLRVAGTLTGLAVATVLFHMLSATVITQIVSIAIFTFVLRSFGAANYGILTAAVSALVVLLIGLTGVSAKEVVVARAVNSIAGGALALTAYWLWPTWERYRVNEYVARLLDAYREYFHAIAVAYTGGDARALDAARQTARLARTNLTASVDRLSAEPYKFRVLALNDILASSHRLVHALMALEAGLYRSKFATPRTAFRAFSNDVEKTLYFLAASLRGSELHPGDLPDLREDHHALVAEGGAGQERYELVNVETDRITNSLNTLREQIVSRPE